MNIELHKTSPYPLRLDPKIKLALEKIAKANSRSLNSEINLRLQATLEKIDPNNTDIGYLFRAIIREELDKTSFPKPVIQTVKPAEPPPQLILTSEEKLRQIIREECQ